MDKLTHLLKEHQVGEWCKRAAWIIVAIGLINIVLDTYSLVLQYNYPGSSPSYGPIILAQIVRFALSILSTTIFYFFILYAAGVALNHFVADTDDDDEEEEEENDEIVDEQEGEEVTPG